MGQLSYNDVSIKSTLFAPSSFYAILIFRPSLGSNASTWEVDSVRVDGERLLLLGRAPRFFRLHWPSPSLAD